ATRFSPGTVSFSTPIVTGIKFLQELLGRPTGWAAAR
ncbi:MAG: hypothetical protein HW392_2231, partial [Steroidobacteraceae bacterium]|nr:hypothetical protein [Steroidobacteraceae bacterium]